MYLTVWNIEHSVGEIEMYSETRYFKQKYLGTRESFVPKSTHWTHWAC